MGSSRSAIETSDSPDVQASHLAARQHGVITSSQLHALGLDDAAIHRRSRSARLHRVHRGVYAVGHPSISERARHLAAVLAAGPDALLSHRAAAHLWGLGRFPGLREVTVSRATYGPAGVIVHTSRTICDERAVVLDAIPVTSVNRTLVDLADVIRSPRVLAKAVHEADFLRKLNVDEIYPLLNGRRGARRLKRALAGHRPADLKSDNEFDAHYAIANSDLPPAQTNVVLSTPQADYVVDLYWPRRRLVVEIDGGGHRTLTAMEEDRIRDSRLQLAGYRVVRYTKRRVRTQRSDVLAEIAAHLEG